MKMKILIIGNFHHKNKSGLLKMLLENGDDFKFGTEEMIKDYDIIYSPCKPINSSLYPNKKFIFGPHFSVYPNKMLLDINNIHKNSIYIQPSEWAKNAWSHVTEVIPIKVQPFPVDVYTFSPDVDSDRTDVFIYFKRRKMEELDLILNECTKRGLNPILFNYVKKYLENDYLRVLKKAKFGIILGAHESQGFAILEALSCNVPLLVWSATTMKQEEGGNLLDIPCTSVPYWNECCGEIFTDATQFESTFDLFIENINTYQPRKFIMDNLTVECCYNEFKKNISSVDYPFHIITGANHLYVNTLYKFIERYPYPYETLTVYDLGLNCEKHLIDKLLHLGFKLKTFDYEKYPEHVNLNVFNGLNCSYAFKSIIVYNEANLNDNKTLIWSDCANKFESKFIIQCMTTVLYNGIYVPIGNMPNTIETLELNHPKTLEHYNILTHDLQNKFHTLLAALLVINYKNEFCKKVIDQWYNDCLKKDIIMPENSSRNNHRQDQTVLSCILYNALNASNIQIWNNCVTVSYWNKFDNPALDNKLIAFKLFNLNNKQMAIIYCKTFTEAKELYVLRKRMEEKEFDKLFYVST